MRNFLDAVSDQLRMSSEVAVKDAKKVCSREGRFCVVAQLPWPAGGVVGVRIEGIARQSDGFFAVRSDDGSLFSLSDAQAVVSFSGPDDAPVEVAQIGGACEVGSQGERVLALDLWGTMERNERGRVTLDPAAIILAALERAKGVEVDVDRLGWVVTSRGGKHLHLRRSAEGGAYPLESIVILDGDREVVRIDGFATAEVSEISTPLILAVLQELEVPARRRRIGARESAVLPPPDRRMTEAQREAASQLENALTLLKPRQQRSTSSGLPDEVKAALREAEEYARRRTAYKSLPRLAELLQHEHEAVRALALTSLRVDVPNDVEVREIRLLLSEGLSDESEYVRSIAGLLLVEYFKRGIVDVDSTIRAVRPILRSPESYQELRAAAFALQVATGGEFVIGDYPRNREGDDWPAYRGVGSTAWWLVHGRQVADRATHWIDQKLGEEGMEGACNTDLHPKMVAWMIQRQKFGSSRGRASEASLVSADDGSVIDAAYFHTFQSIIVGLGGFSQGSAAGSGTGTAAVNTAAASVPDFHDLGYAVHWYPWNKAAEALAEVQTALTDRGVSKLSMYGYSLGGDRVVDIANNLAGVNTEVIHRTAFIDAIEESFPFFFGTAERQLPPGSPKHLNIYQDQDHFLHGGTTNEDVGTADVTDINASTDSSDTPQLRPDASNGGPHIDIDFTAEVIERYSEFLIEGLLR